MNAQQEEREIEARKISGNDQMLYRKIMKYGIHKYIRFSRSSDECYICDVYSENHLIHRAKDKKWPQN